MIFGIGNNSFKKMSAQDEDDMKLLVNSLKSSKAKMPSEIIKAHQHSSDHREEVLSSKLCGCFYCLETFKPKEINEWTNNDNDALCPTCGIDSVIGYKSGYPITRPFLEEMHKYWF